MLLVPFGLGLLGLATVQHGTGAPTQTIAVIQGDVPRPGLEFNAERRAVLDLHAQRTHELAAAVRAGSSPQPTLVIWPENSTDIDPYRNADANAVISAAAKDIGVPILVGAVVQADTPGEDYNMGIVWDPVTGPGATYTKRHPLPFGEYMPYRSFFRIFSDKVDLVRGTFLPGDVPGNLDVAGVNVGDVICFEVVYDNLVRDVVQRRRPGAGGADQQRDLRLHQRDLPAAGDEPDPCRRTRPGGADLVDQRGVRGDPAGRHGGIHHPAVHSGVPDSDCPADHGDDSRYGSRWPAGMGPRPGGPVGARRCDDRVQATAGRPQIGRGRYARLTAQ